MLVVFAFLIFYLLASRTNYGFTGSGLTFFSVRLWLNLFLMLVPSVFILDKYADQHYLLSKIENPNIFILGKIYISYSLIAYGLTIFALDKVDKFNYRIWESTTISYSKNAINNLILQTLLLVIAVIGIYYLIGFFPQKYFFSEKNLVIRADITHKFKKFNFLKEIVQIGSIIVSYKWFVINRIVQNKFTKIFYNISLILVFLMLTHKLEKGPLVFYLLGYVYLYKMLNVKINLKFVISFLVLILLILMYIYNDWLQLLFSFRGEVLFTGIAGRFLVGPTMGFYLMLEAFPLKHEFLGLGSFSSTFSGALGLPDYDRAAKLIQYYYNSSQVRNGTAGVINTYYLGEAWANFGYIGVLVSPIIVGLTSVLSFRLISGVRKSVNAVAILAAFTFTALLYGGFNDYLYNLLFYLYVFMRFVKRTIK